MDKIKTIENYITRAGDYGSSIRTEYDKRTVTKLPPSSDYYARKLTLHITKTQN